MYLEECKDLIHRCIKCGACTQSWKVGDYICPAGERFGFESFYLMGRVELIRGILEKVFDIRNSERFIDIVYSCTDCRACTEQCYQLSGVDFQECMLKLRKYLAEEGIVSDKVAEFLENVYRIGNPYGLPRENKNEFLRKIGIPEYSGNDYLYYIDGVEGYDEEAKKSIKAFYEILNRLDVSVGTLYDGVECSGNEALRLGDEGLFEYLAEENKKLFNRHNVKKILVTSPHVYNAFKNEYPKYGYELNIEVLHYTQYLYNLLNSGKINLTNTLDYTVTYHDPCFLGRYNGVYEEPRMILREIPGLKLVEMRRNRENSFCCGGGGGNFYTDILGNGERDPAVLRVKEAYETGADTIVVACPICKIMLSSGVKSADLEEEIRVKDLAELVLEAMS